MTSEHLELGLTEKEIEMSYVDLIDADNAGLAMELACDRAIADAATAKAAWLIQDWLEGIRFTDERKDWLLRDLLQRAGIPRLEASPSAK